MSLKTSLYELGTFDENCEDSAQSDTLSKQPIEDLAGTNHGQSWSPERATGHTTAIFFNLVLNSVLNSVALLWRSNPNSSWRYAAMITATFSPSLLLSTSTSFFFSPSRPSHVYTYKLLSSHTIKNFMHSHRP